LIPQQSNTLELPISQNPIHKIFLTKPSQHRVCSAARLISNNERFELQTHLSFLLPPILPHTHTILTTPLKCTSKPTTTQILQTQILKLFSNKPAISRNQMHLLKKKPTYPEITHIMMMRRTTTTEREDTTKTTTIATKTSTTKGNKLMHQIKTHPAIPQLEKKSKKKLKKL
jgi:hypothetical protein